MVNLRILAAAFLVLTSPLLAQTGDFTPLQAAEEMPEIAPERIVFRTIAGPIVFALYPKVAPKHIQQITTLVRLGAYDGTHFFRNETNFVLQLSTVHDRRIPLNSEQLAAAKNIPAEFSNLRHRYGVLSMARYPENPDGAESSFSILLGDAPHLDGQYTIFGHVESGFDVVQQLTAVPKDSKNIPVVRLEVISAEVVSDTARLNEFRAMRATPVAIPKSSLVELDSGEKIATLIGALLSVTLLFLLQFLFDRQLTPRLRMSIALLGVFIAFFGLVAALVRDGQRDVWLAASLFIGVLAVIRLMGRFDTP